ncbi:hypothetical protein EVAR_57952_1 [Eumeta japonica]|uniref:Uncharacterized protein n=1 Tax=Eumeta variegata TaxID=151549 RepID=A0A4C1Y092_EUMVA|nr:hypothetical protein EVAR_57952_1 [Eumeta japonica]
MYELNNGRAFVIVRLLALTYNNYTSLALPFLQHSIVVLYVNSEQEHDDEYASMQRRLRGSGRRRTCKQTSKTVIDYIISSVIIIILLYITVLPLHSWSDLCSTRSVYQTARLIYAARSTFALSGLTPPVGGAGSRVESLSLGLNYVVTNFAHEVTTVDGSGRAGKIDTWEIFSLDMEQDFIPHSDPKFSPERSPIPDSGSQSSFLIF